MASIIQGYEYDIFISYRQKDNKGDRWVSEFVEAFKTELESTFKEEISVYFDINSHDGLLETHDVKASLKDKLKCLVFIPIISRTYCDPESFAWEYEFKVFVDQASHDSYGLKVKLPNGNVATRVLPIQIHDLNNEDKSLLEKELGGVLRAIEFIYKEPGVNRPLRSNEDRPKENLNKTFYRNQINKVANTIEEVIHSFNKKETISTGRKLSKQACIAGLFAAYKFMAGSKEVQKLSFPDKSIAVLPFVNDSPDKENDYFCNGMMEEILNQLQKISDLKVKARTSVEKYRNPDKDIKLIGQELGVSLIMEGSVRKIGDDLRITAQLIDTKTGDHLWSEIYDGKYTTRLFEFQSSVAKKVAASLNAVITPQEEKRIEVKPTSEMLAYDLCSRGGEMVRKWYYTQDSLNLRLAFNLFNQALKIDPKYIDAISSKGMTYVEAGKYDSAMIMYDKLQELDPTGSACASGKAMIYLYSNKPDSALKYSKISVDLAPNDPWVNLQMGQVYFGFSNEVSKALSYYQKAYNVGGNSEPEINEQISILYFYIGNLAKALEYTGKAIYLRPECDLFIKYSYILSAFGKYNEALQYLDSTCSISDCEQRCDIMRFHIYTELKEFKKAEKYYNQAIKTGYKPTEDDDLFIACLYTETGRKKEALSLLNNMIKRNENLLNSPDVESRSGLRGFRLAQAYSMIGEKKKALKYLTYFNAKVQLRFVPDNPGSFPGFDSLRSDPEFKGFFQRIEDEKSAGLAQVKNMEQRGEINL
jgi:TolB-like protein